MRYARPMFRVIEEAFKDPHPEAAVISVPVGDGSFGSCSVKVERGTAHVYGGGLDYSSDRWRGAESCALKWVRSRSDLKPFLG